METLSKYLLCEFHGTLGNLRTRVGVEESIDTWWSDGIQFFRERLEKVV